LCWPGEVLPQLNALGASRFGATATAAILDDLEGRRTGASAAQPAAADSSGY